MYSTNYGDPNPTKHIQGKHLTCAYLLSDKSLMVFKAPEIYSSKSMQ